MNQQPQRRVYSLSAEQHQYLNQKAVALTKTLDRPVACRHVLDALLTLGMRFDNEALADKLKQRFSEPRRLRSPK